jgi:hypothetical protein
MHQFGHEIFVTDTRMSCTCGINKNFINYKYARRFAEKHARSCERAIIKPLILN